MKNYAELYIGDRVTGQTPALFGANIEMQGHAAEQITPPGLFRLLSADWLMRHHPARKTFRPD